MFFVSFGGLLHSQHTQRVQNKNIRLNAHLRKKKQLHVVKAKICRDLFKCKHSISQDKINSLMTQLAIRAWRLGYRK